MTRKTMHVNVTGLSCYLCSCINVPELYICFSFLQFSFPGLQQKLLPPARSVDHIENHVIGTLYGHCMADAIGLLTEFMSKQEARQVGDYDVILRIIVLTEVLQVASVSPAVEIRVLYLTRLQHYSRLNEEGFVELSYDQKVIDKHRGGWPDPDWTDDTDQMILIIDSIIDCNGEVRDKFALETLRPIC